MADKTLTILVAGDDPAAVRLVREGLGEGKDGDGPGNGGGAVGVTTVGRLDGLAAQAAVLSPDAVVAAVGTAERTALAPLFHLARTGRCAVVLFAERADPGLSALAVEAGVAAFILDGLRPDRVRPIVDTALARFAAFETLKRERDEARTQLADRKLIDRAKGILMQQKSLTEEQAYTALRKAAMKQGRRIADIAQSIITTSQIEL